MARCIRSILLLCAMFVLQTACGSSNGSASRGNDNNSNNGGSVNTGATTGAKISTALKVSQQSASHFFTTSMSDAKGADLEHLEYFILAITICQDMTVSGTAFNNPTQCIDLYKGPFDAMLNGNGSGPMQPNYATLADYARTLDANSGYIDLMSADSRAKLVGNTALTAGMAGDYQYGLVTWSYPVRIQATLRNSDGNATLYTRDGNTYVNSGGYPYTVAHAAFTQGPSELATVPLGNGGSWFKFQSPFTISPNDIAAGKEYALDLTFNPDGLVYGFNAVPGAGMGIYEDAMPDGSTAMNAIQVPFLDLTPVPRASDQVVVKETYLGPITTGTDTRMDVRIELYSLKDDPNRTIYGVATAGLVNADSFGSNLPMGKAAFISTTSDGSVTLEDWGHHAFLTGLTRQTQVGATVNVTMSCTTAGSTAPLYGNCTDTFPLTLTLTALTELE